MTMKHRAQARYLPLLAILLLGGAAHAQTAQSWDAWMSEEFTTLYQQKVQQIAGSRDSSNQVEAPALATNSTSLLDTSSVSDLIGVGLNLAGLTGETEDDTGEDASGVNGTATLWAFHSAIMGIDPLEPSQYCSQTGKWLRRFSVSAGMEQGRNGMGDATLVGIKIGLGKDVCGATLPDVGAITSFGANLAKQIRDQLAQEEGLTGREFLTAFSKDSALRSRAEARGRQAIALADSNSTVVEELAKAVTQSVRELELQQGYAFQFDSKIREGTGDQFSAKLIYERGFEKIRGLQLSANGGWEMQKNDGSSDNQGGKVALGLRWVAPTSGAATGRRPWQISIAGNASWMTDTQTAYQGQAKIVLPVFEGVELPLSVTVANRTELVRETNVRGQIGFTLDTSLLLNALRR